MKKDRPMKDPSLPSATAGPTVISTAMVSIAVIDRLRTSVISIGYRPILTERCAGAACKGLCAKGDDVRQSHSQQVSPLRSWLISVRATARSDACG